MTTEENQRLNLICYILCPDNLYVMKSRISHTMEVKV